MTTKSSVYNYIVGLTKEIYHILIWFNSVHTDKQPGWVRVYNKAKVCITERASLPNALIEFREAKLLESTGYRISPSSIRIPAFHIHNIHNVHSLLPSRSSLQGYIIRAKHWKLMSAFFSIVALWCSSVIRANNIWKLMSAFGDVTLRCSNIAAAASFVWWFSCFRSSWSGRRRGATVYRDGDRCSNGFSCGSLRRRLLFHGV